MQYGPGTRLGTETFISIDIESDGPVPGLYSMLSLGAVAFDEVGTELDAFSINLAQMWGAKENPGTMAWWKTQPEAWKACRENVVEPDKGTELFKAWADRQPGRKVAVCYPAGFDWPFVAYYLEKYTGGTAPFGFSGVLDMKTYAWSLLEKHFRRTTKRTMPKEWFDKKDKHNHIAVDDAREQGREFFRMRSWARVNNK